MTEHHQEMERFKVVEKETKTKAFSKEGLALIYACVLTLTQCTQDWVPPRKSTLRSKKSLIRGPGSMTALTL